jgi:glycosyltransferase involved in cell wall biosynthesis
MITDWIDWWGRGGIIDELRPVWYRVLFGGVETYYEESFRTRVEGLTVISTALAERAVELGVDPTRIFHMPNGSWNVLFNVPDVEACRHQVRINSTGPIIGFSSLDSHLDLSIVIESLAQLVKSYPDILLLITGKPSVKISELAKAYGVGDNVFLTGFLPFEQLPWYLGCADLFVLPYPDKIYNVGRWPSKINGYMSVGRPTVSNPVGDIKTLFMKHNIGLLADWDASDFSQKITFLLENPEIAIEMGRNSRKVSESEYDWNVIIGKLEDFYLKVLEMHRNNQTAI